MGKLVYIYISIALYAGSLYVSLANNNKYIDTLNEKEKKMREKVVKERAKIYLIANISALLLVSILFMNNFYSSNRMNNVWMYTAIFFLTEYFVYMLIPKKHWMLHSVENKKDAMDWLKKYKFMSRNYHIGMLIGIAAVALFTYNYKDYENINCNIYIGLTK